MLVLASASPRRKEILKTAGLDFTVIPAENEINPESTADPKEYTVQSALYKAQDVIRKVDSDDIVLSADTVVVLGNKIIGKPANEADAFEILRLLSGKTHMVCTGFVLTDGKQTFTDCEVTKVTFRELSDEEINRYIATKEPLDKAGAYGIQGKGCLFVSKIEGDYFNIVGLPVCKVYSYLSIMLKNKKTNCAL